MTESENLEVSYDAFWDLVREASDRPYAQQIPLYEQAVRIADELDAEQLGAFARIRLMGAYNFGGSPVNIFTPFAWVVQRYEQGADWVDDTMRHHVLWHDKWVVSGLTGFPQVPLAQLEQSLERMRRHYAEAGEGEAPVLMSTFDLRDHVHGAAAAHDDYVRWATAPRTSLSDCLACERTKQASHLMAMGRPEEAMERLDDVLEGRATCPEQPERAISVALEPLMLTGQAERAAREHLRGWRMCRDNPDETNQVAKHVLLCARTGQLARGIDLLAHRLGDVDQGPSPHGSMSLAAAGVRLLDAASAAGMGGDDVWVRGRGTETVDTLRARLRERALSLAEQFDRRNGTSAISDMIRATFELPDLGELPLTVGTRAATPPDGPGLSQLPGAPDVSQVDSLGPAELAAAFEAAQLHGGEMELDLLRESWRARRDDELDALVASDAATAAALEYALAWAAPYASPAEREETARAAARLYRQAGEEGEALCVEHWAAMLVERDDEAAAIRERLEVVGTPVQQARALARLVDGNHPDAEPEAMQQVLAFEGDEPQLHRAKASALVWHTAQPDEYLAQTDEALRLLAGRYPELVGLAHLRRGLALMSLERGDEATAQVDEAVRVLEAAGLSRPLASALFTSARMRLSLGRPDEAEPLLHRCRHLAERERLVELFTDATGTLAEVLRSQGRTVEAAELAEAALVVLDSIGKGSGWWGEVPVPAARLAQQCGYLARDLGETGRAQAMFRRAAVGFDEHGDVARAATVWGELGEVLADDDALEATRAYALAVERAVTVDDQRLRMVFLRDRVGSIRKVDGPEAALVAIDEAVAVNAENEARALADHEFSERLGPWDFDYERLAHQVTRARLLASAGRLDAALREIDGVAEQAEAKQAVPVTMNAYAVTVQVQADLELVDDVLDTLRRGARAAIAFDDESCRRFIGQMGYSVLEDLGRLEEAKQHWESLGLDP